MKILVGLLLMLVLYFISFWTMIKGWGVEPKDFSFIMWSYVAMFIINLISVGMSYKSD